jgi:hypothetical protein
MDEDTKNAMWYEAQMLLRGSIEQLKEEFKNDFDFESEDEINEMINEAIDVMKEKGVL